MNTLIIQAWKAEEERALLGTEQARHEQQIKAGKQTARQRITLLLDPESFEEIDRLATSPHLSIPYYTDGVITGFGTIQGKKVALYAQDFTIKGGSLGQRHAEKICKIMDLAVKIGCPIIGLIDSGGARIDEGIHALAGYGKIFARTVRYSGVVPQLSLILGPWAGGAAYCPGLNDFVFMTKSISHLFVTGPQVIEQVLHQKTDKETLGGTAIHATTSGVAHVIAENESICFEKLKQLLALLPSNYLDSTPPSPVPHESITTPLESILPLYDSQSYDMKKIIMGIIDQNSFFEIQELFAPNIITGFARLAQKTIGIVANQPSVKAGTIDIDASVKAARFIQFCDSFDIPIISLVDVPGFLPGIDQEQKGIIRHGAKLLYAYANATVPKITVIIRKAFGGAYIVMGSKDLGADFNYAWPSAQIAVLGSQAAITILHGKKIAQALVEEQAALQEKLEKEYAQSFLNPFVAAQAGYIDAIIDPNQTRTHLIKALVITSSKVESLPKKKHGNIPL
jgi:acetyl-CoA carboxylase carboxyltransferase component